MVRLLSVLRQPCYSGMTLHEDLTKRKNYVSQYHANHLFLDKPIVFNYSLPEYSVLSEKDIVTNLINANDLNLITKPM